MYKFFNDKAQVLPLKGSLQKKKKNIAVQVLYLDRVYYLAR
jgi:hypothetical protein